MKNRHLVHLLKKQNNVLQRQHLEVYLSMLSQLCKTHNNFKFSVTALSLLRAKDFDGLLNLADDLSSQKYDDADEHFVSNQFAALIRKYPWGKLISADPAGTAKDKFFAAEHKCHRINQRFLARRSSRPSVNEHDLQQMRNFISYAIGHSPDVDQIMDNAAFGPGANVGVTRSTNNARKLLAEKWTVTPSAFTFGYVSIMKNVHFRGFLCPESAPFINGDGDFVLEREQYLKKTSIVKHNKIAFVPKTAKVHRTIAIEPLLNSYLQKGADIVLRRRLKRIGLNLEDQTINQKFAREGSLPDQLDPFVTIDLSSASDSISIEMVREILPFDWFHFLNDIRSKEYELEGERHIYHKFCSMGNGFCFPLETLIFAAACTAVGAGLPGKDFLVYGDDIVVRQSVCQPLIALLSYLGFKVNSDKTFLSGPFRESCGADWYEGMDVRPFTLDFALDSCQSIFKILNLTRRSSRTEMFFCDVRDFLINRLHTELRFYRPHPRAADSGIDCLGDEHLTSPNCFFDRKQQVWFCRSLLVTSVQDRFWTESDLRQHVLMWGAMVGAASTAPFSFRGKTRTKVSWEANSESTSTWIPPTPFVLKE